MPNRETSAKESLAISAKVRKDHPHDLGTDHTGPAADGVYKGPKGKADLNLPNPDGPLQQWAASHPEEAAMLNKWTREYGEGADARAANAAIGKSPGYKRDVHLPSPPSAAGIPWKKKKGT